jgi:3-oxoacyl-[acyl-carrier protein] reductase
MALPGQWFEKAWHTPFSKAPLLPRLRRGRGREDSTAMDLGIEGHAILVTGASGGIGTAIARALAAEGARVGVHYNANRSAAEALAAEIGGVALQADLRDEEQADALVPAAVAALGRLDSCVANAGVWPGDDVPVSQMPLARFRSTVDANLTVTFLTARAFLRHVEGTGEGCLVLVGSTAGLFGEAGHADYAAAKAAMIHGLALSLKNEVVRTAPRARVNVVAPGWTVSPMTAADLTPDLVGRVTATMALRRIGETADVARAVAFLCSPLAARHLTGQVLTVAGGMEGRLLHDPPD